MQTKDLLSQSEIDSLLDIFASTGEDKSTDILFEVRMAKAAKGIENYLENLGLQFDTVRVSKNMSAEQNSHNYNPEYMYLENLSIDNSLALSILAARFGSQDKNFSLDRELTSLEKQLLEDVCKEMAYIVEKELDSYLVKADSSEKMADQRILVSQKNIQSVISFSFTKEPVVTNTSMVIEDETAIETDDVAGTKVEAVLGTIATDTLEKGIFYEMQAFSNNRAILLLDKTLPFMAKRLEAGDERLSFVLQEAVNDKRVLDGYYLCVAGTTIDDEALLSLEHGTVLELNTYNDVQIHKDARMVAKAKVLVTDGEITVKVLKG